MINDYNSDDRRLFTFKSLEIKIANIKNFSEFIKVVNFIKGLSRKVEVRLYIST